MTYNNWVYIAVMAAVSYAIRVLPLTLIRKPLKNQFIQSFLYYVPYVTLAVMTFPAIINATQSPIAGAATLVSRLDWNQPRNWSPPSIYMSAGKRSSGRSSRTAAWVEPESNQTSMMSVSLVHSEAPHFSQTSPAGMICSASYLYQASEPSLRNSSLTALMVASVMW